MNPFSPILIDEDWCKELEVENLKTHLIQWIEKNVHIRVKCRTGSVFKTKPEGQPWHADNCRVRGQKFVPDDFQDTYDTLIWEDNHSPWYILSASMLISDPKTFEGGELQFFNTVTKEIDSYKENVFKKIVLFSSGKENIHRVTPQTNGERWVNLFFFCGE